MVSDFPYFLFAYSGFLVQGCYNMSIVPSGSESSYQVLIKLGRHSYFLVNVIFV